MKERFEGLSVWREKQREEKEFLEGRLDEARSRMEALSSHNQELSMKVEELEGEGEGKGQVREREKGKASVHKVTLARPHNLLIK